MIRILPFMVAFDWNYDAATGMTLCVEDNGKATTLTASRHNNLD